MDNGVQAIPRRSGRAKSPNPGADLHSDQVFRARQHFGDGDEDPACVELRSIRPGGTRGPPSR